MDRGRSGGREGRINLRGNTAQSRTESSLDTMERLGENSHLSESPRVGREAPDVGRGREERGERAGSSSDGDRVGDRLERGGGSGGAGSRGGSNGSSNRGGSDGSSNRGGGNGSSGSSGGKGKKGKGSGSKINVKTGLITWAPWVFLVVLLFTGMWNNFKVPFVYDRSMKESLNLFLFQMDNTGPYNHGQGYSGFDGIQENRIDVDMVYEMGIPRYYVYVFNSDDPRNWEFEGMMVEYEGLNDIPIFKISSEDAMDSGYVEFAAGSPQVVEMTRVNKETRAEITHNFYFPEDWKKEWVDNRDEKKWYEVFK